MGFKYPSMALHHVNNTAGYIASDSFQIEINTKSEPVVSKQSIAPSIFNYWDVYYLPNFEPTPPTHPAAEDASLLTIGSTRGHSQSKNSWTFLV